MSKAAKRSISGLAIAIIVAAAVAALAYWLKGYQQNIPLSVPERGVSTECEYVVSPASANLRKAMEPSSVAAWHDNIIFDYTAQAFCGLQNAKVGDEIVFGTQRYKCSFAAVEWNAHEINVRDFSELPDADLYLCACAPLDGWYEMYIIGAERNVEC